VPSISRIPSDAIVIGAICGACGCEMEATQAPDFCGACRARFDKGAPLAMVYLDVSIAGVTIEPVTLIDYLGVWTAAQRVELERDLHG